jgi:hypothetical protein
LHLSWLIVNTDDKVFVMCPLNDFKIPRDVADNVCKKEKEVIRFGSWTFKHSIAKSFRLLNMIFTHTWGTCFVNYYGMSIYAALLLFPTIEFIFINEEKKTFCPFCVWYCTMNSAEKKRTHGIIFCKFIYAYKKYNGKSSRLKTEISAMNFVCELLANILMPGSCKLLLLLDFYTCVRLFNFAWWQFFIQSINYDKCQSRHCPFITFCSIRFCPYNICATSEILLANLLIQTQNRYSIILLYILFIHVHSYDVRAKCCLVDF